MPVLTKKLFSFDIERGFFINNFDLKNDRGELCLKALFNGITCAIDFLLTVLKEKNNVQRLYIDGGLTKSDYLAQTQSSISDICVVQKSNLNTTLQGVAFLIGLYKGIFTKEEIKKLQKIENKEYFPAFSFYERKKIKDIWNKYFCKTI